MMNIGRRVTRAHVVVPPVMVGAPVFGHGAIGVGAVLLGSLSAASSYTAGNPITMNPFQHNPQTGSYQPFSQPINNTYTLPFPAKNNFPPIPTYGYHPYY